MSRRIPVGALSALVGAWVTAGAAAETVVLTPVADNTMFNTSTPTANGAGASLFCGRTGEFSSPPGIRQRALVRFDLEGAIPPGATIDSVTLTMMLLGSSAFGGGDETHAVHRVEEAWGEGTSMSIGGSGAAATPGDATWEHTFFPDELWATTGGSFAAAPSATQVVGTTIPSPIVWGSTTQLVADVELWLSDPAANFGWIMLGNEVDLFSSKRFGSREGIANQQPVLTIEFTPPVTCLGDCGVADGVIDAADLEALLDQWGGAGSCDLDGGGVVGINDLLDLLARWGACESLPAAAPEDEPKGKGRGRGRR